MGPVFSFAEFVNALTAVPLMKQTNLWLSMLFRGNPAFREIQRGSEDKWKRSRRKCTVKRRYDLTISYLLTANLKIACFVTGERGAAWEHTRFSNCRVLLDGAANNTVQVLQGLEFKIIPPGDLESTH